MKFASFIFLALILFVTTSAMGQAIWSVKTKSEVLKGDAKGVSIKADGSISLAPSLTEIYRTGQPYIWSSVVDRQGNIFLGTGGEGRIFKTAANGGGTLFADLDELNVTALAIGNNGDLFAATSPDGKVYKIDNAGKATVYFEPGEKYIWSLAVMSDGSLAIGTGENGKIFRVKAAGAKPAEALFYDTSEAHIITMAIDHSGNLIAGTDASGLVLRFSADGKPFGLLDSPLREIHDISISSDGSIYALALSESIAAAPTAPAAAETPKPVTAAKPTIPEPPVKSRYDLASAKSAVYKISPDGGHEIVWSSATVSAFSIRATHKDVLIGTSDKGRIYSVSDSGEETLLLQSDAGQISNIFGTANSIYASASNQGILYKIGPESVADGSFISPVFDAGNTASWGRIWWNGSGGVTIETRSGNTERPTETWTQWQPTTAKIASSPARYIQWRAILKPASSPVTVSDVHLAYATRNIAPEILSLSILPTNVGLLTNPPMQIDPNIETSGLDPASFGLQVMPVPPRRAYQRGAVAFQWNAEDRNGDKLLYNIYYKEESNSEYKLLKADVAETFFTLDGLSLADGVYTVKVVVSDALSNPPTFALLGERASETFIIDNTQPTVTVGQSQITGSRGRVVFNSADRSSYITRAEYSMNGGNWVAIFPVDGISDSPEEQYIVDIDLPTAGEYSITLRVFDAAGNMSNARALLKR